MVAYASSFDVPALFAKTVSDAAFLLQIISGPDPYDSTCLDEAFEYEDLSSSQDLSGVVVGIPQV